MTERTIRVNTERLHKIVTKLKRKRGEDERLQTRISMLEKTLSLSRAPALDHKLYLKMLEWVAEDQAIIESLRILQTGGTQAVVTTRIQCPTGIEEGRDGTLWIACDVNHDYFRRYLGLPLS